MCVDGGWTRRSARTHANTNTHTHTSEPGRGENMPAAYARESLTNDSANVANARARAAKSSLRPRQTFGDKHPAAPHMRHTHTHVHTNTLQIMPRVCARVHVFEAQSGMFIIENAKIGVPKRMRCYCASRVSLAVCPGMQQIDWFSVVVVESGRCCRVVMLKAIYTIICLPGVPREFVDQERRGGPRQ